MRDIEEKNLTKKDFIIQKAEIQFNSKEERSDFNAVIKYKADNKYLISIRSRAGLEAARLFIDEDTVLVNDRINKKLYCGSSAYLKEKYGISVRHLALVFGDLLFSEDEQNTKIDCRNSAGWLTVLYNKTRLTYDIDCRREKVSIAKIEKDDINNDIVMNYSDYRIQNNIEFPERIKISSPNNEMEIMISIKKMDLLDYQELRFIPGENFEKINLR